MPTKETEDLEDLEKDRETWHFHMGVQYPYAHIAKYIHALKHKDHRA